MNGRHSLQNIERTGVLLRPINKQEYHNNVYTGSQQAHHSKTLSRMDHFVPVKGLIEKSSSLRKLLTSEYDKVDAHMTTYYHKPGKRTNASNAFKPGYLQELKDGKDHFESQYKNTVDV